MEFNQNKRCQLVTMVFVEGELAGDVVTLIGIDKDGHEVSFKESLIAEGRAIKVFDIAGSYGQLDEDGGYHSYEGENDVITKTGAAYHVVLETEPETGIAYIIDEAANCAFLDRGGISERMDLAEFSARAYRCDLDGKPVTAFAANRHAQYRACADLDLVDHMEELDTVFARLKTSESERDQMDGYFHDIQKNQGDGLSYEEIYDKVYRENPTPLHERFKLIENTEGFWTRAVDAPVYRDTRVRAALKFFLKKRLGDFPVEEISATMFPTLAEALEKLTAAYREPQIAPSFKGETYMPGYETTEVYEFDAKGLTVIAFTDMGQAGYAYAYPTRRNLALPAPEITYKPGL